MQTNPKNRATFFFGIINLILLLLLVQSEAMYGMGGNNQDLPLDMKEAGIEFMELKRRNWENHGTDTTIDNKGRYQVKAAYLGKAEKIREGTLTAKQLSELAKLIEQSRFPLLENEYKGPFKTEISWWGYQLRIETKQWVKSIRFHSEDETVPEKLKEIVNFIMKSTT